jgi:hypothetical protein
MKKVVIWGTGKNAVDFKLTHDDIKIVCFIDSCRKKDDLYWDEIPILLPEEATEIINKEYIVVATSENVYQVIRELLIKKEKKEFRDFTYHTCFEKKLAVLYGNCHIWPIKCGLTSSSRFNEEYAIYPLPPIHEINERHNIDSYNTVFHECDLFIHQSVRKDNRYGEDYSSINLMGKLKKESKILAVPNLYGLPTCFYPTYDFKNGGNGNIIRDVSYFPYRDSYIEKDYAEGINENAIVNTIENGNVLKTGEIARKFDEFIKKVKLREREWDIFMSDWILVMYKEHELFYDANHPTEIVMKKIINEIFNLLDIDDDVVLEGEDYVLDSFEIPIYGQVAEELGLKYRNNIMRKMSANDLTHRALTVKEYVDQYIRWNMQ